MGGAVVEVKFPYVYEDVDRHGNVRVYFWRKGCRKVRLREVLGSPEFVARYHELIAGDAAATASPGALDGPGPGSWRWLCEEYMRAPERSRARHEDATEASRPRARGEGHHTPGTPGPSFLVSLQPALAEPSRFSQLPETSFGSRYS